MMSRIGTLVFASVLFACSAGGDATDSSSDDLITSAPKPPAGLMFRNVGTPEAGDTFMTSSVAMVDWAAIQPTGPNDQVWTALDHQLAILRAGNITHARLRIMSGGHAPVWVKKLGAPDQSHPYFQGTVPTSVIDCTTSAGVAAQNIQGPGACVPFFWTQAYLDAYEHLMTLVNAHIEALDSQQSTYAQVATVVDSACMVVYAEVFYRGQGVGYTNQTLYNAGLTHAADINCQKSAIGIHKSVFGDTRRTSVAINNWDVPQAAPGSNGNYRTVVWNDTTVWGTYQFAEWARKQLDFGQGSLLEVQNNGLHTNSSCSGDPTTDYFCYIAQYPARHGFQTQSYESLPKSPSGASLTLLEDLDNGLKMHAQYIELPGGLTTADWKLMACYDEHIRSGNASPCPH